MIDPGSVLLVVWFGLGGCPRVPAGAVLHGDISYDKVADVKDIPVGSFAFDCNAIEIGVLLVSDLSLGMLGIGMLGLGVT